MNVFTTAIMAVVALYSLCTYSYATASYKDYMDQINITINSTSMSEDEAAFAFQYLKSALIIDSIKLTHMNVTSLMLAYGHRGDTFHLNNISEVVFLQYSKDNLDRLDTKYRSKKADIDCMRNNIAIKRITQIVEFIVHDPQYIIVPIIILYAALKIITLKQY